MVPRALEEHHRDGAIEMITLMLLLCDAIIYPHFLDADDRLFSRISHNATHVLKPLLPTNAQHSCNLRDRRHNFVLIETKFATQSLAFYYQTTVQIFLLIVCVRFFCSVASSQILLNEYCIVCLSLQTCVMHSQSSAE